MSKTLQLKHSGLRMMMRRGKSSILTISEKCRTILASNWQGKLNTIKADSRGSKEEIYSSKVKYFVKKGKPYIWVPEKELHNVNTIIDERASFAVSSQFPGPLAYLLKSINKLPTRVALVGDVLRLKDEKVNLVAESLQEILQADLSNTQELSYSVSGILNSSSHASSSRSENLKELLTDKEHYAVYKFDPSSCMYLDGSGRTHEVNLEDIEKCKADPLTPFSTALIDGINQSETRRRALVLFCITFLKEHAKDAFLLSIDRKGFDVLGKVLDSVGDAGSHEYRWKELRFTFKDEAHNVESFCKHLVRMEEDALKNVSEFSGI
ncbi:uncharacterized protein LOC127241517 [Andrographis paniculata]|uniref:uncharacterized protein LOC127241517 n=1 Tax=Andrographis paniculata TaxID=175694 RepID=UPI0021E6E9E3|nr:uncharacterized protein LOC127241517 [Andrographis paniculata]